MLDVEWVFLERFILAVRAPNRRKPINHRFFLDGMSGSPLPVRHGEACLKSLANGRASTRHPNAQVTQEACRRRPAIVSPAAPRGTLLQQVENARRVVTRYEKAAESFLGLVDIASIRLWVCHLST